MTNNRDELRGPDFSDEFFANRLRNDFNKALSNDSIVYTGTNSRESVPLSSPTKPTMCKLQKRLSEQYFTDKKMNECADLVKTLDTFETSLDELVEDIQTISSKLYEIRDLLADSVEMDKVEMNEKCIKQAKSYIKDMGCKDMTTLLAISAKWNKDEECQPDPLLPNVK